MVSVVSSEDVVLDLDVLVTSLGKGQSPQGDND